VLGPLLFALLLMIPMPGLTPGAHRLAAVMALAIVFWVTEAIPMAATAMLAPALCIPLGVASQAEVLKPFANPIVFLFVGSFLLAEAMRVHQLDRRIALWILTRPGVTRSPFTLFAALGGLTAVLSMWMSNSATAAMMLPIGLGVLGSCPGLRDKPRVTCNFVLLIAFAASIGGLGTPVGTPPNLITMAFIKNVPGETITFFDWMKLGVPLAVLLMAFLLWILRPRGLTFGDRSAMVLNLRGQFAALGPVNRGERNTAIAFGAAVSLWMYPGLVELIAGRKILGADWLVNHLPEETIGLAAGLLLFLLPVDLKRWRFTLTWQQGARIDWGTILLFGGGLSLGTMIFNTKLAEAIGEGMISQLGQPGLWLLIAAGIVLSLILSEAASNTASANVMVPLMIALAKGSGLPVLPVALATGMACSLGFMLPVSTPPNAIGYGTGLIPLPRMIKAGILLDLAGAIAVWLVIRAFF
jgi:sodium-dependent dicarboxylate transporter 2/3/5